MATTRLRVTLRHVTPVVARVLDVPVSTTLPELHDLLQAAMGWTDSHLHQFVMGDTRYSTLYPSSDFDFEDSVELDETDIRLRDLPERFAYIYDFGDGWQHDIGSSAPAATPRHASTVKERARRRIAVARPAMPSTRDTRGPEPTKDDQLDQLGHAAGTKPYRCIPPCRNRPLN